MPVFNWGWDTKKEGREGESKGKMYEEDLWNPIVLQVNMKYNFKNYEHWCPEWANNAVPSHSDIKCNSLLQVLVIFLVIIGQGNKMVLASGLGWLP